MMMMMIDERNCDGVVENIGNVGNRDFHVSCET